MTWRLATSLDVLRKEINVAFPNRKKQTDGTIGDPSHAAQGSSSDHNPWLNNTVRAWDITTDTFTTELAEWLRLKGKAGDPRLVGGGMVIHRGRIASDNGNWEWRSYGGSDRHDSHIHLSVSRNQAGYDSAAPWGFHKELDDMYDTTARNEVVGRLDKALTILDEMFKKVAYLEAEVAKLTKDD